MPKELEALQDLLTTSVGRFEKGTCGCFRMFAQRLFVPLNGGSVRLTETPPATLNNVRIVGLSQETIVVKPDHFGIHYYKNNTYNKACDYLILTKDASTNKRYAIFIDLKTDIQDSPNAQNVFTTSSDRDASCGMQFCGALSLFKSLGYGVDVIAKCNALTTYQPRYWVLYKNYLTKGSVTDDAIETAAVIPENVKRFRKSQLYGKIYALPVNNGASINLSQLTS